MKAILKRELGAYFKSPIGYIFLAVYYFFSGLFFYTTTLSRNIADLTGVFSSMFMIVLIIIPIITMKLLSDEKRQKTDQATLTAPVTLFSIVFGKYMAALVVFAAGIAINFVFAVVLSIYAEPAWAVIWGNLLGTFLLGAAFIAIGLFISSLTESQVIAAISTFAISLFIVMLDATASSIQWAFVSQLIGWISFYQRYSAFTMGILDYSAVVFFLSVAAIFLFLTLRVLDKKRWS